MGDIWGGCENLDEVRQCRLIKFHFDAMLSPDRQVGRADIVHLAVDVGSIDEASMGVFRVANVNPAREGPSDVSEPLALARSHDASRWSWALRSVASPVVWYKAAAVVVTAKFSDEDRITFCSCPCLRFGDAGVNRLKDTVRHRLYR